MKRAFVSFDFDHDEALAAQGGAGEGSPGRTVTLAVGREKKGPGPWRRRSVRVFARRRIPAVGTCPHGRVGTQGGELNDYRGSS